MKLLLQRVTHASVEIDGETVASVGVGFLVLVGCRTGDTVADADYLADRMVALRVFCDEEGRMNRSLADIGGEALLVSQFTLYADTRKGNRPGFSLAGPRRRQEPLRALLRPNSRVAQPGARRHRRVCRRHEGVARQ